MARIGTATLDAAAAPARAGLATKARALAAAGRCSRPAWARPPARSTPAWAP